MNRTPMPDDAMLILADWPWLGDELGNRLCGNCVFTSKHWARGSGYNGAMSRRKLKFSLYSVALMASGGLTISSV